jgi:hypothetical protein
LGPSIEGERAHEPIYNSTQFDSDGITKEKVFNVGMYGPRKLLTHMAEDGNRILEDLVAQHQGAKWLYADSYYSRDEFRRIYDVDRLERLREKYDATSLPGLTTRRGPSLKRTVIYSGGCGLSQAYMVYSQL